MKSSKPTVRVRAPSRSVKKKHVLKCLKSLGNYKPEYEDLINIYVDMLIQYEIYQKAFTKNGYRLTEPYTNKAGATNYRKTPLALALENLRRDIVTYSDRLRLNPKADMGDVIDNREHTNSFDALLTKVVEASE